MQSERECLMQRLEQSMAMAQDLQARLQAAHDEQQQYSVPAYGMQGPHPGQCPSRSPAAAAALGDTTLDLLDAVTHASAERGAGMQLEGQLEQAHERLESMAGASRVHNKL